MLISKHAFHNCTIEVENSMQADPDDPTGRKTLPVTTLRIEDPQGPAIYRFPMTDELRKTLIRKLTGGVAMATSLKEIKH